MEKERMEKERMEKERMEKEQVELRSTIREIREIRFADLRRASPAEADLEKERMKKEFCLVRA